MRAEALMPMHERAGRWGYAGHVEAAVLRAVHGGYAADAAQAAAHAVRDSARRASCGAVDSRQAAGAVQHAGCAGVEVSSRIRHARESGAPSNRSTVFTGAPAFTGDDESGDDGDTNELRQARHELRRVLHERKRGGPEEKRRIAEILRRATAEILGKV